MLLSASIGALAFWYLGSTINLTGGLPWGILSVILIPAGFASQLLTKLYDAKELEGLTQREETRLRLIIGRKVKDTWLTIGFYVIAAATIAILFWLIPSDPSIAHRALALVGGLIGLMIWTFSPIAAGFGELSRFRSLVASRKQDEKGIQNALKKLREGS